MALSPWSFGMGLAHTQVLSLSPCRSSLVSPFASPWLKCGLVKNSFVGKPPSWMPAFRVARCSGFNGFSLGAQICSSLIDKPVSDGFSARLRPVALGGVFQSSKRGNHVKCFASGHLYARICAIRIAHSAPFKGLGAMFNKVPTVPYHVVSGGVRSSELCVCINMIWKVREQLPLH